MQLRTCLGRNLFPFFGSSCWELRGGCNKPASPVGYTCDAQVVEPEIIYLATPKIGLLGLEPEPIQMSVTMGATGMAGFSLKGQAVLATEHSDVAHCAPNGYRGCKRLTVDVALLMPGMATALVVAAEAAGLDPSILGLPENYAKIRLDSELSVVDVVDAMMPGVTIPSFLRKIVNLFLPPIGPLMLEYDGGLVTFMGVLRTPVYLGGLDAMVDFQLRISPPQEFAIRFNMLISGSCIGIKVFGGGSRVPAGLAERGAEDIVLQEGNRHGRVAKSRKRKREQANSSAAPATRL